MNPSTSAPTPSWRRRAAAGAAALLMAAGAHAEKADRTKPMEILADRSGTADLQNQITRFNGNVVINQGTLTIKADRVEIRQGRDGYHSGTAWGGGGSPVTYRQKRDGVPEWVEGVADKVEFDGRTEVLQFIGNAVVRRLRDGDKVDEITGSQITWNHAAEQFSVQGGTPTAASPDGRVRAVLTPRAAAAPASAPGR